MTTTGKNFMPTRRQAVAAIAAPALSTAFGGARAQGGAAGMLEVLAFGGGVNWPLWIAIERGFLDRRGVAVNLRYTPNSVESMQALAAGRIDIAMASIDNLIAYMEGQGEAPLPAPPQFFAFLGNQRGLLRVVARPEIRTWADLRGQPVAVDALTTGFAFVLYRMMEMNGVSRADVKLERLGATPLRVQALAEGRTMASIVNAPLDAPLMARGFTRLGDATEVLGAYQGTVATAHRPTAEAKQPLFAAYTAAWVDAMRFLQDPANRDAALAIYERRMQVERPAAEGAYALLLGQRSAGREGLNRDGRIDIEGVRQVLELRSRYGQPPKTLGEPSRYVDERWLEAALAAA